MTTKMPIDPRELQEIFRGNKNIMEHLRSLLGSESNEELAILYSYDAQAGSYLDKIDDPAKARENGISTRKLAEIFDRLGCASLLHAGTGEAKTICHAVEQMSRRPELVGGFDISLSRLLYGRRYARTRGIGQLGLFAASMSRIPVASDSIDIVFTSHSIEPNRGRERELIEELYRVARRYLVLREPSFELGNADTRAHIEKHKYVKGIPETLETLGYDIVEHRLFGDDENPRNQAALTIIDKDARAEPGTGALEPDSMFVSPVSGAPLTSTDEAYYCVEDGLIFPVISGIPCLLPQNGILATKYLELHQDPDH